jgi:polysaccharide export outer membrane protein
MKRIKAWREPVKKNRIIFTGMMLILFSILLISQERVITEYKIGPKDVLEISVYNVPEFNSFKARVDEDGSVTLPLLGIVDVNGLTKIGMEKKLKALLAEQYVNDPQVTVFIAEYGSNRVNVTGAVTNPGPYPLLGRQTLMSIIGEAGGLTQEAGDKIIVYRDQPNGDSTSYTISIDDLYLQGKAELNIPLQPNDEVIVPIDKVVNVYVHGAVKQPGAIEVKKSEIGKFTLQQAIAAAGGFDERAAKSRVRYTTRDENGIERKLKVNVKKIIKGKKKDIILKEGDIIFVPETIF